MADEASRHAAAAEPQSAAGPSVALAAPNGDSITPPAPAESSNTTKQLAAGQRPPRQAHSLHAKVKRSRNAPERNDEAIENERIAFERRVSSIKEGDIVMIKLPSDIIKVITVNENGTTSIGKYGAFPTAKLIGKPFDITYEIVTPGQAQAQAQSGSGSATPVIVDSEQESVTTTIINGKVKGKTNAARKGPSADVSANELRPMKRQRMEELEVTDATNDLIDDNPDLPENQYQLLTPEEIMDLRKQGVSAEEIMRRQIERHQRFGLKTEYSKEKWRKKKEKKFSTAFTPLAPTVENMLLYYTAKSPLAVMSLRMDTISQMINIAAIRPGGRYLIVEDTGGLIIGALLERMGGDGRIMQLTESDSPPAWPVLEQMNVDRPIVDRVLTWLNWNEAEEDYIPVEPEDIEEDEAGSGKKPNKLAQKSRRRLGQRADLNARREELYGGDWDGLIIASNLSPPSILDRLTPHLAGSATITIYSPFPHVLAQTLDIMREAPEYLAPTLTESWMRNYQVLPGRTHPMMTTSGTGGYLLNAITVLPGENIALPSRKKQNKRSRDPTPQQKIPAGTNDEATAGQEVQDVAVDDDEEMS